MGESEQTVANEKEEADPKEVICALAGGHRIEIVPDYELNIFVFRCSGCGGRFVADVLLGDTVRVQTWKWVPESKLPGK